MSRFFSEKYENLVPYTPGEQPKDRKFIKLNTNESPFPPSKAATEGAREALGRLQLYSDPECTLLCGALAEQFDVGAENIICTNGSDEVLNFAFMAFCDSSRPAVFPDITYGFYPVFAKLSGVPFREIPLREDFTICVDDYIGIGKTIFIANPNAPTGIALSRGEIEKIVASNPDNIVVIDEAYVDFGGESCIPLTKKYDNLLVCGTFSKSRSMAGARLGFGVGGADLIRDLQTIRFSTNPYNVNSMTMAAGLGALSDREYFEKNCREIIENREMTSKALKKMDFIMTKSSANFLFVRHPQISGEELYGRLREKGILVRHFTKERICDYNRITVGSRDEMEALISALSEISERNEK